MISGYYNQIKNELLNNEVYKRVKDYSKNRNELSTYYNVGKLLIEEQKVSTVSTQLSWSHYCELLSIKDIDEINYYIITTERYNLSVRELRERIKNKEYQRLDDNTKLKLINKKELYISDTIKNPIIIKNKLEIDKENVSEKMLQKIILEDIEGFMRELGDSFSFIGSEYKIKINNAYNYIDLLLFNIKYNCYVVVELKVTEVKKEHIGQIEVYMNYIDKHVKNITNDRTIGIIVARRYNHYYIEYSSDKRIYTRDYELV